MKAEETGGVFIRKANVVCYTLSPVYVLTVCLSMNIFIIFFFNLVSFWTKPVISGSSKEYMQTQDT